MQLTRDATLTATSASKANNLTHRQRMARQREREMERERRRCCYNYAYLAARHAGQRLWGNKASIWQQISQLQRSIIINRKSENNHQAWLKASALKESQLQTVFCGKSNCWHILPSLSLQLPTGATIWRYMKIASAFN